MLRELVDSFDNVYSGWILWNLFLALIPLLLSRWLYRRRSDTRTWGWWLGIAVYLAFLPNAPYLLTDIIHLIRGIQLGLRPLFAALIFIPLHVTAIILGFEAYVTALIYQGQYLKRLGAAQAVLWSELLTHLLCSIGIFLGRFRRYNSWDLVADPDNVLRQTLDDLTSRQPLAVMVITFIILTVLYWIAKQITLGLVLRVRYAKAHKPIEI